MGEASIRYRWSEAPANAAMYDVRVRRGVLLERRSLPKK